MFEDEYEGDNLIVSTKTEYDAEENALRPKVMADYIGQEKVKENLSVYIAAAKQRGEALDHFYTVLPAWERPLWRTSSPRKWAFRLN